MAKSPVVTFRMDKGGVTVTEFDDGSRMFYVDCGNLPKHKAEAYLKDAMNRAKKALEDTRDLR